MSNHTKHVAKILIVLLVSLFLVNFLSNRIFIAYTPQINTQFLSDLRGIPATIASLFKKNNNIAQNKPSSLPSSTTPPSPSTMPVNQLPLLTIGQVKTAFTSGPFKQLAQDVYAYDEGNTRYIKFGK